MTWQSFNTARSWSCALLQITEPWIEQPSPMVTWFMMTELTTCGYRVIRFNDLTIMST
jgi:hypothetical protein